MLRSTVVCAKMCCNLTLEDPATVQVNWAVVPQRTVHPSDGVMAMSLGGKWTIFKFCLLNLGCCPPGHFAFFLRPFGRRYVCKSLDVPTSEQLLSLSDILTNRLIHTPLTEMLLHTLIPNSFSNCVTFFQLRPHTQSVWRSDSTLSDLLSYYSTLCQVFVV